MEKPKAFILDVDGTVAYHDLGMRGHYEYTKVKYDLPICPVIEVVNILADSLPPVVVSGRMDEGECRTDTEDWITRHVMLSYFPLFMRQAVLPSGKPDHRPDYIVKEEIYWNFIEPQWDIQFAIDDRLQVCRMWHSLKIPVFRVGDPDANF